MKAPGEKAGVQATAEFARWTEKRKARWNVERARSSGRRKAPLTGMLARKSDESIETRLTTIESRKPE